MAPLADRYRCRCRSLLSRSQVCVVGFPRPHAPETRRQALDFHGQCSWIPGSRTTYAPRNDCIPAFHAPCEFRIASEQHFRTSRNRRPSHPRSITVATITSGASRGNAALDRGRVQIRSSSFELASNVPTRQPPTFSSSIFRTLCRCMTAVEWCPLATA